MNPLLKMLKENDRLINNRSDVTTLDRLIYNAVSLQNQCSTLTKKETKILQKYIKDLLSYKSNLYSKNLNVGDRVIVNTSEESNSFFLGTITDIVNQKVFYILDNSIKSSCYINDDLYGIVGICNSKKKNIHQIPLHIIRLYLDRSRWYSEEFRKLIFRQGTTTKVDNNVIRRAKLNYKKYDLTYYQNPSANQIEKLYKDIANKFKGDIINFYNKNYIKVGNNYLLINNKFNFYKGVFGVPKYIKSYPLYEIEKVIQFLEGTL